MNSRNLLNIVLALVVTGLVLLVIYEPGKEIPSPASRLTGLDQAAIKTIVIEQPQQAIIKLQKTGEEWQMQEPLSVSANNELLDNLLEIANTTSHSSYNASEMNLDQLQLTRPALRLQLNQTSLSFGTTDALRGYRYVLTGARVHLITDRFSHLFRGKPTALISPSLFPGNTKFTKLVVPGLTLQLDENGWSAQPERRVKSADHIQMLLDEWRFARAQKVSLLADTDKQQETERISTIEIHTSNKEIVNYNLKTTTDEILLVRPDKGLQYHFDKQTGIKLLGIDSSEFEPDKSQ